MSWPITEIDTSICYVDNIKTIFVIFYNLFEITPKDMIQTRC